MALHTTSRAASDFDMPAAATETEPTPRRRSPGLRRLKRIGWNLIPPLTFVAIVGLWSLAIQIFKIPAYLLPGPGAVFQRLVVDAGMLWLNAKVTLTEIVLGFALTVLAAIPLGLVIALYNPISRARPWQLGAAFTLLRQTLGDDVPVIFGRAIGRPDARLTIVPLAEADAEAADMATLVIIGTAETRIVERPDLAPLVYTPRFSGGA